MSAPLPPIYFRRLRLHCEIEHRSGPAFELTSPEKVVEFASSLVHEPQEVMLWIGLDIRKRVVAVQEIFRGTVDQCTVHPRDIYRSALVLAPTVSGIILIHNHPSGMSSPSDEDHKFFDLVTEAGKLLHIPIVDCMIVSEAGAWSRVCGEVTAPAAYRHALPDQEEVEARSTLRAQHEDIGDRR